MSSDENIERLKARRADEDRHVIDPPRVHGAHAEAAIGLTHLGVRPHQQPREGFSDDSAVPAGFKPSKGSPGVGARLILR